MKVIIAVVITIAIGATFWLTNQGPDPVEGTSAVPVISREQILSASDLVEGVKQALQKENDHQIDQWLDKALEVAKAANLANHDINYIASDAARDYVIFQAKRSQFNDAIRQAYYQILDIGAIKAAYPEAQDLFASADKLIAQRDDLIEQIAAELAKGQTTTNADRQAARQQWLKRHNTGNSPS